MDELVYTRKGRRHFTESDTLELDFASTGLPDPPPSLPPNLLLPPPLPPFLADKSMLHIGQDDILENDDLDPIMNSLLLFQHTDKIEVAREPILPGCLVYCHGVGILSRTLSPKMTPTFLVLVTHAGLELIVPRFAEKKLYKAVKLAIETLNSESNEETDNQKRDRKESRAVCSLRPLFSG
ncbi:hypothetical protein RYX36_029284 [Vicia faba]